MNSSALNVAVVSEDENLLREVSWCLTAYGYQVKTTRQFDPLVATWQAAAPDFLIVDYDHPNVATVSKLSHLGNESFTYKILLCDMEQSLDHIAELEYSYNDAVSKPLNLGELLARLRSGTSFLDFERSLREQSLCDRCTGLLSRSGLLQTLRMSNRSSTSKAPRHIGLVLMSVDFLDSLTVRFGTEARDQLLCEVADIIEEAAGEKAWIARIRPHAFAMAFLDSSIEQAEMLAEVIRLNVAAREFKVRGESLFLTATLCVNALDGSTLIPEKSLAEAEKNLQYSETLGGSTVSRCGQFDDSYANWVEEHINSGAVGSKLTAQDIMTPFTAVLRESDIHDDYLAEVRESQLAVAPYFDGQGKYQGILRASAWEDAKQTKFDSLVETPLEISERASRDELVEHFTEHRQELLVVMCGRQPLGYITNQAMAEILAPVSS